jgi:phospholipase/carboxylesterase
MLACDVALRLDRPPAGLVLMSGTLVAQQEWTPLLPKRKGLKVLQSHGNQDPLLPFAQAERLRDLLTKAGLIVDWVGFRGGHEIPELVLSRLSGWLKSVLPA